MGAHRVVEAVGALAPPQAALVHVKVQAVRRGGGPGVDPPLGDRIRLQPSLGAQQHMQALDGCLDRIARWASLQGQRHTSHRIPLLGRSHRNILSHAIIGALSHAE